MAHQLHNEGSGFAIGAATEGVSLIDKWWLPEDEILAAVGRAIRGNSLKGDTSKFLGMLLGIGDGGGAQNKVWFTAIVGTEATEAAEHISHMRAEDAAIDMGFVDDHILQVAQKPGPIAMTGQDA
jgi:hypothetical protein